MISLADLIIYAVVGLVMSTFSGIAGGGGGFIMTPLLIFLGLSPAQAVATGKFNGLAITLGSIGRLRKEKLHSWRLVLPMMGLATVIGISSSFVIVNLDGDVYRRVLGLLLLVMIPVVLLKKLGQEKKEYGKKRRGIGYVFLSITLYLQAIFSTGMGSLVNMVLMSFFGMTALEASVTKRLTQLLLNTTIIIGVFWSGLIVWQMVLVGVVVSFAGGHMGSAIAVRKGNKFVTYVFATLMLVAAIELLLG